MTRMNMSLGVLASVALSVALGAGCRKAAEPEGEHAGEKKEGHQKGLVELTPEQVKNAGIQAGRVERRSQAGLLEASAQIEAPPQRQAKVGSRIEGRVTDIRVNSGEQVKAGQLLAVVDSPEVGRAKADFLAALARSGVAAGTAEREKALFEKRISSEREWREAEAEAVKARADKEAAENRLHALGVTDADLERLRVAGHYDSTVAIVAPIAGVLVERKVTLGQMVAPADTLFSVVDLREVWILLDVYERDLAQVRVGQDASVRVAAYPGQEFKGRVANVGAVFEAKSRATKARVVLANPEGTLRPGMFATVTLEGTTGDERTLLVAPTAAIQRDGEDNYVFIPRGDHEFEGRRVRVGRVLGDWTEILEGVSEGESVVTAGSFLLKSEMKKGELGEQGH
jgi:cobalt-zinc-cadmium efflux system membrane fusion protein